MQYMKSWAKISHDFEHSGLGKVLCFSLTTSMQGRLVGSYSFSPVDYKADPAVLTAQFAG